MSIDNRYDDIIGLEHPEPKRHMRMSEADRAAQFAPFAALTGFGAVITESGRLTAEKLELDEMQRASLNEAMASIIEAFPERTAVEVTFFVKDRRKSGGEYRSMAGRVKNIDGAERVLVFEDGTRISLDDIYSLSLQDKTTHHHNYETQF